MSRMALELEPRAFRCVWGLVIGLHLICAVFLSLLSRVYVVTAHPYVEDIAYLVFGSEYPFLHHASVVVALVSALHWWQILDILWSSLRSKELRATRLWRLLFGRFGVFGVESRVFRVVFTVRELAEVVSQSFQARRSSELLPRPWLNHLLVALVVSNCWSTPVAQHFLGRRHPGLERVVCLLIDALLNVGSCMAIPLAIFLPYYQALSPVTLKFPIELQYNSIWFSRLVMETRLLFSLATCDVLSKLVQHLGIYASLTAAVVLIRRRRQQPEPSTEVLPVPHPATAGTNMSDSVLASDPEARGVRTANANHAIVSVSGRRQTAVHVCFLAWGLALLSIHIKTAVRYQLEKPGCSLATAPWFASSYPCSVYDYNCYRHGTTSPNESSWSDLDPGTLVFFSITHCTELRMPRRFQSFRNLVLIQLYNNTLVEWNKESAVSATQHTHLTVVAITRTNLSGIPDGLLQPLPAPLQSFQITHTNLTTLPPDLHTKWHALGTLYLEHSLVREFPKTLLSLPVRDLSLHGNHIETIPELAGVHQHFLSFVVSANPLSSLPDSLGESSTFQFFSAERTLLKTLPSWLQSSVSDAMYLFGTPYCEAQTTSKTACAVRHDPADGKSPTPLFDAKFIL